MRDPYTVLGVGKNASQDDIKKAYRKLAKDLHPDRHPDDSSAADRFKEVSAAYNLLGDVEQRARYDRGEIGPDGQERATRTQYRTYTGPEGADEHFGGFHGGGAGASRISSATSSRTSAPAVSRRAAATASTAWTSASWRRRAAPAAG